MSSNEQMSKEVEDGVVEQPGNSRVRYINDEHSGFSTTNLSEVIEEIARRHEADHDDNWVVYVNSDNWVIYVNSALRIMSVGFLPPPPAAPRDLLSIPESPRTPASVQRGAFRGQARDAQGSQTPRSGQDKAQNELFCGNCLKQGHRVRDCVHPAEDGFVHGCPICNKADHESAEDCKQTWPQRLERKLAWAIEHRANRPTLAAFPKWAELFMEAVEKGDITLPSKFPWTPFYAQELRKRETQPWTDFDYVVNDSSKLPSDPVTASQETVIDEWKSLFLIPLQVIDSADSDPSYPLREEDEWMDEDLS